jgi:hypothetical protein
VDAHRWTQRAQAVTCPEWLAAFERVRWLVPNAESVRLLASGEVNSPLSWGWRNPVILIDPDTLGQPDDAEAILAHEVAHIRAARLARADAVAAGGNPVLVQSAGLAARARGRAAGRGSGPTAKPPSGSSRPATPRRC